jgi:hypothetical protein
MFIDGCSCADAVKLPSVSCSVKYSEFSEKYYTRHAEKIQVTADDYNLRQEIVRGP